MIIGIDGNEANVAQRVGIGQYAYQMLQHLYESQKSPPKADQPRAEKFKIYLKEKPLSDLPEETAWWKYAVFGPMKLWTQFALPMRLYWERERPDVFFSPSHYAPRWCPCPRVIAIMDLSYLHFPELFTKRDLYQLTHWTKYSISHVTTILTISEYTKQDIVRSYAVAEDRVVVTYPGYDVNNFKFPISNFKLSDTIKKRYGIQNDYILFVGTLQPRKNIIRLVEAFERISDQAFVPSSGRGGSGIRDLQLVIVGKRGWMWEDIVARIKSSPFQKDIIIADFVSDDDLPDLYRSARCFVLPSLYEGFGIPVIEAMACGCPVVTSNVSSLPEIVGDAGMLVNPNSADDLADAILEAGYNEKRRQMLIKKGLENVKRFSWDTCAEQTLHVLQTVANV